MALRAIRVAEDSVLTKKCRPVTEFNDRLHTLLDDMRETLLKADGVGLAAPQVGILRRVFLVLDTAIEDDIPDSEKIVEMINPEILESSGEQTGFEGCLSIPGMYGTVTRPDYVKMRAQDRNGNWFEYEGRNLTARAFCHENDHLDGHLFSELAPALYTEEELEKMSQEQNG